MSSSVGDVRASGAAPTVTRLDMFRVLVRKLLVRVYRLQQTAQVNSAWGSSVTWTGVLLLETIIGIVLTILEGESLTSTHNNDDCDSQGMRDDIILY